MSKTKSVTAPSQPAAAPQTVIVSVPADQWQQILDAFADIHELKGIFDKAVSLDFAARRWSVSRDTLDRLVKDGRIPIYKVGKQVRVKTVELDQRFARRKGR